MIVGIGVDTIERARVERELTGGSWAAGQGVFTDGEIARCERGAQPGMRYATCFAAKEATLKALGREVEDLGLLREVELVQGGNDKPAITLHARMQSEGQRLGVRRIWLSMAATEEHACAVVIVES